MKRMKQMFMAAGGLLALADMATFVAPRVGAALKGALVEVIIPSHPYWGHAYFPAQTQVTSLTIGPGTGTLGITSITISNFTNDPNHVYFQGVTTQDPGCQGPVISTGEKTLFFISPAKSTTHYVFPAPVVAGSCYVVSISSALQGVVGLAVETIGIVN